MKEEDVKRNNEESPKKAKRKVLVRKVIVDGKVVRTEVVEPGSEEERRAKEQNRARTENDMAKKRVTKGKSPKSKGKRNNKRLMWIILINCAVIALLAGVGLVASHFMLQSGTRHGVQARVPDFQSMTMAQAKELAAEGDLQLIINDSIYVTTRERGAILDQTPKEGTVVKPGRAIYLTINATQNKMVDVPYVAGRSLRQAKSMLEVASLTIEELIFEEDIATNYILAQYCNGEEITDKSSQRVSVGTGITLKVGVDKEHAETITPMLIGKALYLAENELWDTGLNVGEISSEEPISQSDRRLAFVLSQSHPSDSLLMRGTKIDMEITLDHTLVDTVLVRRERARVEAEELLLREKEIADSLAMAMGDTITIEPVKPKAKKVEFKDLFN